MRKVSVLLVGILALLILTHCPPPKPPPPVEPETPVVTEREEPAPPEVPEEEVTKRVITQEDLQPIYFDFDKYNLRTGDREILNRNALVLKENLTVRIRIEGNCDERGTVEYNLALGEKRARAAKDFLINLGIDPDRITFITYGKEKADRCYNEECWYKDRRDDFAIVSQ